VASLAEKPAGDSENFDRARFDQQVRVGAKLAGRYRLARELRRYPDAREPQPQAWVGFDEVLNREVGIDLIASGHPRASAVEAAARGAATVPDVRFVQVLDVADENGLVYVVKEWISDSSNLTDRLVGGPLSVALATRIARELAVAIAEAHSCDITHGALDPNKVLLTSTNQVKILGLRLETALCGIETGPETALQDVKAIGALWYAALTGRWPTEHSAFGLPAAPFAHGKPFSPAQVRAAIPKAVDQVVEQVLESAGGDMPTIDSAKTLTTTISALPRLRDEAEATDVLPRPVPRRAPVYPVAAPTAVHQIASPTRGGGGGHGGGSSSGAAVGRVPRSLLAVIIGVVVVIIAVAAFQLGGGSGSSSSGSTTSSTASSSASSAPAVTRQLSIANASIWDSDKGTDDVSRLAQSYNGSAEGWITTTYLSGPDITSYRKGTGVIFDLGSAKAVGKVTFTVGVPGATAEVWTADASLNSLPSVSNAAPAGFSKQATKADVGGGEVDVTFSTTVTTRYVMVWFTVLPHQDAGGFNIAGYRDNLANVKIFS
jgi:serine/threonine protein kinase